MTKERLAELQRAADLMKGTPNGSKKWQRGRTVLMAAVPELLSEIERLRALVPAQKDDNWGRIS